MTQQATVEIKTIKGYYTLNDKRKFNFELKYLNLGALFGAYWVVSASDETSILEVGVNFNKLIRRWLGQEFRYSPGLSLEIGQVNIIFSGEEDE